MNKDEEYLTRNERIRQFKRRRIVVCCVVFSVLIISIVYVIIIAGWKKNISPILTNDSRWFLSMGSEACIRLVDMNGDGLDDILVALTEVTAITNEIDKDKDRRTYCESLNVEAPCSGTMYGIRGYDFAILWSFRVKQSIFELVCDQIDIDQDGYRDCIGSGRQATLVAFNPRNGKILWGNEKIKSRRSLWNFYNPIVLPIDVDGDGMNDILISHGGNPTIPSNVHEREAGCLIMISSRNGDQIGKPFWMPDGKETYMSPVLYGNSTVLFGTGGETVAGGLYSISLENILERENRYVTIMKSFEKGVMVPPIVLDTDGDGIDDILVSCFDGTLELIDGKTMKSLWTRVFNGFEFYTTPAPGDFNSDLFVDFMIILNCGEWDRYSYSQVIVVDGLTGETLWSKNNSFGEFTSPLTLQMKRNDKYQDAFLYRQRGQTTGPIYSKTSSILFHGIGLQDGEISSNPIPLISSSSSCDTFPLNESLVHILLTNIQSTRLIAVIYPPTYNPKTFCTDFEPMERSGGAIGDVNGDGILDTVDITTFITKATSMNLSSFVAHSVLTRFSLDTNKIESQFITKEQTWNAYLGRFGTSHYYRTISP